MLRSMTGFGAASSEGSDQALRVEIRSVNHRHLLVKTRLAPELAALEAELERAVKKRLLRGSVTVNVHVNRSSASAGRGLDHEVAAAYRRELGALAKRLDLPDQVSLDALVSLPGVVAANGETPTLDSTLERRLLKLVREALDHLVEMRELEGTSLEKDLRKQAGAIAKQVGRIERRMPTVVRGHQQALQKRVDELVGSARGLEPSEIAREVAVLADRLDVSEEVARLRSHLDQLDLLLGKGGPIGRKLDFLVQEVFRETNTIGAKCSDAQVAHWVVDAKAHAERMREQAQNVE